MSKERLEEVVKNVVFLQCGLTGAPMGVELPEDDYWYLYEQAERVQELEQRARELEKQIKRYREYLELIRKTGVQGRIISTGEIILSNEAFLAEEALEGEE